MDGFDGSVLHARGSVRDGHRATRRPCVPARNLILRPFPGGNGKAGLPSLPLPGRRCECFSRRDGGGERSTSRRRSEKGFPGARGRSATQAGTVDSSPEDEGYFDLELVACGNGGLPPLWETADLPADCRHRSRDLVLYSAEHFSAVGVSILELEAGSAT